MSATIGLTGSIIATATAIDARPLIDRLLGRGLPETGIADRVHSKRTALAALFGYLRTRSITVLNSLPVVTLAFESDAPATEDDLRVIATAEDADATGVVVRRRL